jgi:AcrR family transcriptional regulator
MEVNASQKKEFVIITAIDLIYEFGINNVSTKELSRRNNISESMIFKMYPKKNDLILAVLNHFSLYDNDMFLTAKEKSENSVDAILFYLNKFLSYYENYPTITALFQAVSLHSGIVQIDNRAREINFNRVNHLKQFIIVAQETGYIDKGVEAELVAEALYSVFVGMCIKWGSLNYGFPLKERTDDAIWLVLKSVVIKLEGSVEK